MYPKSDTNQLKREIKFNEAMDRELKQQIAFDAHFQKESGGGGQGFLQLIPAQQQPMARQQPWVIGGYRNWLLMGLAFVATLLLLVLIFTERRGTGQEGEEQHFSPNNGLIHSHNNASKGEAFALIEEERSTTTTTTEATTARRVLSHIFASIIVNNASVPQMDRTLFGSAINRADPYVELYVIDGSQHRKVGTTPVEKNTLSPKWNYLFEHETRLSADSLLNFELWDSDRLNSDELIGKLFVKTRDLMADGLNGQLVRRQYGKGWLWFTVHWREVYS